MRIKPSTTNTAVNSNITELARQVIAASERETAQAVYTAGWALRPQFKKAADVTTADRVRLITDYVLGRIQYEKPEGELDMFTGRVIYHNGEETRNGVRIVWANMDMFETAKRKLDGALRYQIRKAMKADGIKLRNAEGALEMAQARKDFYLAREQFEQLMGEGGAVRIVADRLFIGEKVQARSLERALSGTVFADAIGVEGGNRLLSMDHATTVIDMMLKELDAIRDVAFAELPQEISTKQATKLLATREAKEILTDIARVKSERLWKARFWLAYALTVGEPVARVLQMTPSLLAVTEALEDPATDDLIGYFDSYERSSTPGMDADGESTADGSERNLRSEGKEAQQAELAERTSERRMSEIMEVMANGCDVDEARAVWDESGRSANAFAGGFEDQSFEDILASGKIPVSINRAKAVEAKIERNRTLYAEIEEIAALLGKRAKDEDWVLQTADFDFNSQREEAISLFKNGVNGRSDAKQAAYRIIQDSAQDVSVI